jgi:hypothetical protein
VRLGRRDSNLCISKSDLLNFIPPEQDLGVDRAPETFVRSAARASLIRDAEVRVLPPGLRVLANSDSICRGSNPAAPTGQSVSNASHMKVAQKPRGTARFRRYELVSVCGIRQWRRHSCLLSPRAFFGVSFLMCSWLNSISRRTRASCSLRRLGAMRAAEPAALPNGRDRIIYGDP